MLVPILLIASLVSIYIGSYMLNKKIPVPNEFKDITTSESCKTCHNFSCAYKK